MFDTWINEPVEIFEEKNKIEMIAGKNTNFFVSPTSDRVGNTAPIYTKKVESDFTITCKVQPTFNKVYDAGALMLYVSDYLWIKFALEYTDLGYSSAVSVVTNGYSDDANGEKIDTDFVWLRMSKKSHSIGLYYSLDSNNWKMVRLFRFEINNSDKILVGLEVQSPGGEQCKVLFEDIHFVDEAVSDFRKGQLY